MTTPLQPPPKKPALQSFEFDSLAWWGRSGIWIVAIFVTVAFLVWLTRPGGAGGMRKNAEQVEAVSHARLIGLALTEFQKEYGTRPDGSTIEEVRRKTGTDLKLGTKSSNDFFRQLVAVGIVKDESIFHAKIAGAREPDNLFAGSKALEKGECAFTYFLSAVQTDNPNRPVAAAPMIPGTDRFDPVPFNGKAVVLSLNNSVTSLPIGKDGHIWLDPNFRMVPSKSLMDPSHPIWDGHPPEIAWPE